DEESLPAAAHRGVHLLEVRPPQPLALVVGVAHVVADRALFAADVAGARHGVGWVARPPGACNAGQPPRMRRMSSLLETPGTSGRRPPPPPRARVSSRPAISCSAQSAPFTSTSGPSAATSARGVSSSKAIR